MKKVLRANGLCQVDQAVPPGKKIKSKMTRTGSRNGKWSTRFAFGRAILSFTLTSACKHTSLSLGRKYARANEKVNDLEWMVGWPSNCCMRLQEQYISLSWVPKSISVRQSSSDVSELKNKMFKVSISSYSTNYNTFNIPETFREAVDHNN